MKTIAVICMLIDHIGLIFFPQEILWRVIGRIAMPIFAFGIARGAYYTSSLKNYMKKILIFSFISQIPFWWVEHLALGRPLISLKLNIGFTFLFALVIIALLKRSEEEKKELGIFKLLVIAVLLLGADLLGTDYGSYGVLVVLMCYLLGMKSGQQGEKIFPLMIGYTLLTGLFYGQHIEYFLLQEVGILGLMFVKAFKHISEQRIGRLFYIFYPVHLFILCLIKWGMMVLAI